MPHDTRDGVIDFVRRWSAKTEIGAGRFIRWLAVAASKFYSWRERYGRANEHNGWVPRDFWLEDWEKQRILDFHFHNPLEGYRRLTFMMLDADIVAVSPARGRASSSHRSRISIGTLMFLTSTSPAPSTTWAACSTDTAASSSTGIYASP